jgi:hypothetical protein
METQQSLTFNVGHLCLAIHPSDQKPSSAIELQHTATIRLGLSEVGIFLGIFVRKHDAVDRLLPAATLDTVVRPRIWHASYRRSTRPMLTQPGGMRRLHLSRLNGRSLSLVRRRMRCHLGLNNCRFRLLGTHHFASNALRLRRHMGSDRWWISGQLDWLCKIHQDIWISYRYWNGHFAALREQGSWVDHLRTYQREVAGGTAYARRRLRLRHPVRRYHPVYWRECFVGWGSLCW